MNGTLAGCFVFVVQLRLPQLLQVPIRFPKKWGMAYT